MYLNIPVQEIVLRLVLSAVIGGVIGAEREYRNKSAGFRTLILISMGSCLFTLVSMLIEDESKDRIASNVVTGIGFVGAGVIFKSETGVKGLTTAATVWVTAAIGMAVAGGFYWAAGVATFVVLVVLFGLSYVGVMLERRNLHYLYKISFDAEDCPVEEYERFFEENRLRSMRPKLSKSGSLVLFQYNINGSSRAHEALLKKLLTDRRVKNFESIDPN